MIDLTLLATGLGGLLLGGLAGILIWNSFLAARKRSARAIITTAELKAAELVATSERSVAVERERLLVVARQDALGLKEEAVREASRRRDELDQAERRLTDREAAVGERQDRLRNDERAVEQRRTDLAKKEAASATLQEELQRAHRDVQVRLERVAGLSAEDAAREVRQQVEDEARTQAAALARDIKEKARREAEKDARRIISMATQRLAAEHTAETTVATVALPSDEMKGRIIGREGRNIRAFELATGVDVIIDDTPDTVAISCFDPIRREVARRALEALIADGRIHPGRVEELVTKMRAELDKQLVELGEQAAYDVGVHGLHPELIKLVGRMRYRSSYGQNLYEHSKEVAWLAGMMAAELHLDVALAKRGGLVHDIGKVLTHESEGTHVQLGVEVCRKYGESAPVINCIEAHHDDVAHESSESVLVQASDAISGSRPGARREAFESYIKRLTKLEEIASGYPGVDKTTVIQAGREIRVIVKPEQITDGEAQALSETIARRIENELQYPGQIRVTVIRETRASDIAK
ncbi:MAG TPA: ribonuclease Y [Gemmatimonadales bacterium]